MERFQTFITESLDKPYWYDKDKSSAHQPFTHRRWHHQGEDSNKKMHYEYEFWTEAQEEENDGNTFYLVTFKQLRGEIWECMFELATQNDKEEIISSTTDIIGGKSKEAGRIFSTVIQIIKDFLSGRNHHFPEEIISSLRFRVKSDEPSRIKLYKRLFNKVKFKDFNYKRFTDKPYEGYYTISIVRTGEDDKEQEQKKEEKEKKND